MLGIRYPLLFGIVVSLLILIPNNDASSISNEFQIYQNEKIGLTVNYPSHFIIPDSEFLPGMVAGYASQEKQINFNIIFEYAPVKGSIEDFVQPIIDNTRLEFNNFQLVESETISVAGVPSWKFVYTTTDLGFNAKAMQIYTLKNEAQYVFTFLTLFERFEENLPVMQEIIDSIRIENFEIPIIEHKNPTYKFKIKYPENYFIIEEDREFGYITGFISPYKSMEDTFPEEVNIVVVEGIKDVSLGNLVNEIESSYPSEIKNFKMIESKSTMIVGNSAHKIVFTGKILNPYIDPSGIPVFGEHFIVRAINLALSEELETKAEQTFFLNNDNLYIVTYRASPDDFDSFLPQAQKIIDSFELEGVQITRVATIPDWIRNNAEWWAQGAIGDSDFTNGIQFMIKENIISIPDLPKQTTETAEGVPDWVRNNAGWWADGLISDDDFISGIKYLVEQGIIQV